MFRFPRYFIVLFVCLSILTAFGIHQWTVKSGAFQTQTNLSSNGGRGIASLTSEVFHRVLDLTNKVNREVKNVANGDSQSEIEKCQCTVGVSDDQNFTYEDVENCSSQRKVYENVFRGLSPVFREERAKKPAEFPRACLTYILNIAGGKSKNERRSLSRCQSPGSPVARGGVAACLTPTYVNVLYNYFGDIADCMDIPQREYLPKFFEESGLQLNALGPQYDAGIIQSTSVSTRDANRKFHNFKEKVLASSRESCQRLQKEIKKLEPVTPGRSNVCGFIAGQNNPLTSFFYLGIKHHMDRAYLQHGIDSFKIMERLARLGFKEPGFDREQLFQMLGAIGYNSGASTAVVFLHGYLKKIEATGRKISRRDFDFGFTRPSKSSAELQRWQATFPAHVLQVQRSGTPKYGFRLRERANQINQVFKEGVCVPHSYLAL